MLKLDHISWHTPDGREVLEDVSLTVPDKKLVVITGPNGGGKTTIARLIAGINQPDSGRIWMDDTDITDLDVTERARLGIGYAFQQPVRFKGLTVRMLLETAAGTQTSYGQMCEYLASVGLCARDYLDREVNATLSGGERGRVALAKLMLRKDNFLILDEPTNHLDMDSREVLECALDDFDGTILTVSHDRYFINRVANRIIEMTDEGVTEYTGNYDDYLEKKRQLAENQLVIDAAGKTRTQIDKEKRAERLSRESARALKLRFQQTEKDIAAIEQRLTEIEAEMGRPETWQDRAAAQKLEDERQEKTETLARLYEDWETLAEQMTE